MNYIVKLDGAEYGPVDELTLSKWVEEDRLTGSSEIRPEMIGAWSTASDMPFLKDALESQRKRLIENGFIDPDEKTEESFIFRFIAVIWGRKIEKPFEVSSKPCFTGSGNRFSAFCFDALILLAIFAAICIGGLGYALNQAKAVTEQAPLAVTDNLKMRKETVEERKENRSTPASAAAEKKPSDPDSNEALLREGMGKAGEARDRALEELHQKFGEDFTKFQKGNFEALTPPTIYADRSAGYRRGYLWVNTADDHKRYVCLSAAEENAVWMAASDLSRIFTMSVMAFLPILLLYYAFSLGYYAQTPGMWFYGIFICRRNEEEVYFFRAFCYTLMLLTLGVLTPLFVPLFKRGPHDLLCGVYVYNVVAGSSGR